MKFFIVKKVKKITITLDLLEIKIYFKFYILIIKKALISELL